MKITGCVITKNEERCLARCLDSYKAIADELIVVDTGSSDRTVEIAQGLGARVLHFDWIDDFAAAKNHALEHAQGDWIIFIDADEWFPAGHAQALAAFLKTIDADATIQGVWIRQSNLREDGGIHYIPALRVFRCDPAIRFAGRVHEVLRINGQPLKTATAPPDTTHILHDGYIGARNAQKAARNIPLLLRRLEHTDDATVHYHLAQSYDTVMDYARMDQHFRKYLAWETQPTPLAMHALLRMEYGMRLLASPDEEREALAGDALSRFPDHPSSYLIAGNACFELQDWDGAQRYYEQAIKLHARYRNDLEFSQNLCDEFYPTVHLRLAFIAEGNQQLKQAQKQYLLALDGDSTLYEALCGYASCSRVLVQNAQSAFEALLSVYGDELDAHLTAIVDALRIYRPDALYLLFFERWAKAHPVRDHRFISMQLAVGEYAAAVEEFIAQLRLKPLWCGTYLGTADTQFGTRRKHLDAALVEAVCAALLSGQGDLILRLVPSTPPAMQDALLLCTGADVNALRTEGMYLLTLTAERLEQLKATPHVQTMWQEVLSLFASVVC